MSWETWFVGLRAEGAKGLRRRLSRMFFGLFLHIWLVTILDLDTYVTHVSKNV